MYGNHVEIIQQPGWKWCSIYSAQWCFMIVKHTPSLYFNEFFYCDNVFFPRVLFFLYSCEGFLHRWNQGWSIFQMDISIDLRWIGGGTVPFRPIGRNGRLGRMRWYMLVKSLPHDIHEILGIEMVKSLLYVFFMPSRYVLWTRAKRSA